jgi:transcriptional regulator with XRE-family HTH domain
MTLLAVRKGNPISIEFGKVLRQQRHSVRISQEALALTADVDRTFVSQIERGVRQPTLTTLWKLAKALKVKPSTLVLGVEQRVK